MGNHTIYEVKIKEVVPSGVVAYLEGIRGFIPASKLAAEYVEDLDSYVGKKVQVQVITADEEENRLVAMHHPFTAPMVEDFDLLDTDPIKARSNAYDMVINGQEAGGGSIRIHNPELQKKIFNLIGLTQEQIKEKFGFFVDAFRYGAPPHGGLAFGLDRLTMLVTQNENIKDVIAFPKVQSASCLMSDAPSVVDKQQLEDLKITCTENN